MSRINNSLVLVAMLIACAQLSSAFLVKRCDGSSSLNIELLKFKVSACPTMAGEACKLEADEEVNVEVEFKTFMAPVTKNIFSAIGAVDMDGEANIVSLRNACVSSGLECPLVDNKRVSFQHSFKPKRNDASAAYRVELIDDKDYSFFCAEFPVQVKTID